MIVTNHCTADGCAGTRISIKAHNKAKATPCLLHTNHTVFDHDFRTASFAYSDLGGISFFIFFISLIGPSRRTDSIDERHCLIGDGNPVDHAGADGSFNIPDV